MRVSGLAVHTSFELAPLWAYFRMIMTVTVFRPLMMGSHEIVLKFYLGKIGRNKGLKEWFKPQKGNTKTNRYRRDLFNTFRKLKLKISYCFFNGFSTVTLGQKISKVITTFTNMRIKMPLENITRKNK